MNVIRNALALLAAFAITACAGTHAQTRAEAPRERQFFVVAANPLATEAGLAVLRRGGSAVDAAVAVQAMLSLVEPQSSGVGGGAFMTYFDARSGKVTVYDGREVAPAGASETMFLDDAGKPLSFFTAVLSGRATGVPGAVRLLGAAHDDHGKLPWRELFGDAERTAREGFIVSPRLGRMLGGPFPENSAPDVRAYFSKADGTRLQAGDRLANPAYAEFLQRLAAEGVKFTHAFTASCSPGVFSRPVSEPASDSFKLLVIALILSPETGQRPDPESEPKPPLS